MVHDDCDNICTLLADTDLQGTQSKTPYGNLGKEDECHSLPAYDGQSTLYQWPYTFEGLSTNVPLLHWKIYNPEIPHWLIISFVNNLHLPTQSRLYIYIYIYIKYYNYIHIYTAHSVSSCWWIPFACEVLSRLASFIAGQAIHQVMTCWSLLMLSHYLPKSWIPGLEHTDTCVNTWSLPLPLDLQLPISSTREHWQTWPCNCRTCVLSVACHQLEGGQSAGHPHHLSRGMSNQRSP